MKRLLSALLFSATCTLAHAESALIVIAKPEANTTTTAGEATYFSKNFEVFVSNTTRESVDLQRGCWMASGEDLAPVKVDVADEKLNNGKLAPGKLLKGKLAFASTNRSVWKADTVRFVTPCKNN